MSQFADDSMTPSPISVKRDKFYNEIPSDQPMHENATAAEGGFNFSAGHYDDSPGKGGFGSYGRSVEDLGRNPQVSRTSVDNSMSPKNRSES